MDTFATSINSTAMVRGDDGVYYGMVPASRHNMGTNAFVVRAVYKNDNIEMDNILCAYETKSNGDILIFADEPVSIRVTIGRGVPLTSSSAMGEGEDYADA